LTFGPDAVKPAHRAPIAKSPASRSIVPLIRRVLPIVSHVAVLMATFNGGRFVAEQLVSLAGQSAAAFDLMVSDDGSTDDTRAKLESARTRWRKGRFDIISGPRDGGHAGNFRHLFLALNDDPVAALSAASSQRHADARRP
jgi:hypothetical protein